MYPYNPKIESLCRLILEEEGGVYGYRTNQESLMKTILNNKENFCLLLNQFVNINQTVEVEKIERVSSSFLMGKDNLKEIDFIYKTKDNKLYYLLEYQTVVDKQIVYRMLNYTMNLLKEEIETQSIEKETKKLPQIIPIVFYTGNQIWDAPKSIEESQEEMIKEKKKLTFEYVLIDQHNYTEEQLLKRKGIIAYTILLQRNLKEDQFLPILEKILRSCTTEKETKEIKKILNMILTPVLGEKVAEKFIETYQAKNEKIQNEIQVKKEMIEIMVRNGASIQTIHKYMGISKEKIKEILRRKLK